MNRLIITILFSAGLILNSCSDKVDQKKGDNKWSINLPSHFEALPIPDKNPMNNAKVELGAYLFYDPILSRDSSISCSDCHFPEFAFSDGQSKSIGIGDSVSIRNSPVLFNLAYYSSFMMDGGVPTLELQVVAPLHHEGEMGFDLFELSDRLSRNSSYQGLSQKAFSRDIDAGAIAYSLAAFQRSLLSYESSYDSFLEGDKSALNAIEKRGMELFFSDSLNCSTCHSGVNFTDYAFYNIGLYESYADPGRWRVSEDEKDIGKFKVPTLRNIEYSAPYMHDGSVSTLAEVILFKMSGGNAHLNKSDKFKGFQLEESDQLALLSFLISLSDPSFIEREVKRKEQL